MIENFSRLHWATLILLACFTASPGRLSAEEFDEAPDAAAEESEAASAAEDEMPTASASEDGEPAVLQAASPEPISTADGDSANAADEPSAAADLSSPDEPIELPTVAEPHSAVKPAEPKKAPRAMKMPAAAKKPARKPSVAKSPAMQPVADSPAAESAVTETPPANSTNSDSPATVADSSPLAPAPRQIDIEAGSFQGIEPGRSTADELAAAWGPPKEIRKTGGQKSLVYSIESFPKVTATFSDNLVASIMVHLDRRYEPEELAKQLHLDTISSVQVTDDQGRLLGEAFPERGILFSYSPNEKRPRVSQVVFEPIDAQPFLFRGESYLSTHYSRCLSDADSALEVDPKSAQAHALRARVYFQSGDFDLALRAAEAAEAIDPASDGKLLMAKILIELSDFTRARDEIRSVLENKRAEPVAKARAYCLLGDCVALAPADKDDAMPHHMQAIKLAEKLNSDKTVAVRRAAKEVLLDAHLGVARDIGGGHWQQKVQAIDKWVDRAAVLAQDLVRNEQASEELLWRVDRNALAALAGVADPGEVSSHIDSCMRRAHDLIEGSVDPARTARLKWQFGLALASAADIAHARRQNEKALRYGRLAVKFLEAGNAAGRQLPDHDFLIGRVYYTLGVIEAVAKQDHVKAREWYGQAIKLLESPVPPTRLSDPGKHGEAFVSMAVSYWEHKERDESLRLTKQGLRLMETAVEDGLLNKASLAVPYGNLASMHAEMGDKELAEEFSELASKCEGPKR
jgi:tetratricopeptide (TPR) repeat protein